MVSENSRTSVEESFIEVEPVANRICGDKKKDAWVDEKNFKTLIAQLAADLRSDFVIG